MKIGVLGLGPVGSEFARVLPNYGHELYVYDPNEELVKPIRDRKGVYLCDSEEAVGRKSQFLLGCMDMLSGEGFTRAVSVMEPGTVASGDFSAKTPELKAYQDAHRPDVGYYSIHTMFAPNKGFNGQLVIEIPVYGWLDDGNENEYITAFRDALQREGARFRRIWSIHDHDERMATIQGGTSMGSICAANTFAQLGINPMKDGDSIYGNSFDRMKFQMALRAIGTEGSSNPRVYGLIAMMNPFVLQNIRDYEAILRGLVNSGQHGDGYAEETLEEARMKIGPGRVDQAVEEWKKRFGPPKKTRNSNSSHLAEAIQWSRSGYPLDIFHDTPSPPYRMRELMALVSLKRYKECIENMRIGDTHDTEFFSNVNDYVNWAINAVENPGWEPIDGLEDRFFRPPREAFPDEMRDIVPVTNELISKVME